MSRTVRTRLILAFLNTLFLIWGTFFLLNAAYPYGDESELIKWTSFIRNQFRESTSKPDPTRFVFINVAYDKALIPKYDDEIPDFPIPIGVEPITDREKLVALFHTLNKQPENHKFIMCDIFFAGESEADSSLQVELLKLKNYCVSFHKKDDNTLDYPMFKASRALADYETYDNICLKFRIFHDDSLVSVPLKMYQTVNKATFKPQGIWNLLNDEPVLNSFIIDHRVRPYDFWKPRSDTTGITYNQVYLNELLMLDDEAILDMTKDKIIVIGDFVNDVHETIYGDMPGSVILLNTYLALEAGENSITWGFLVFLFISYMIVSYRCFDNSDKYDIWIKKVFKGKTAQFIATFTGYALFFALLSIASYLFFNKHLTILVLAIYMNIMERVYSYIEKKFFTKKEQKTVVKDEVSVNE